MSNSNQDHSNQSGDDKLDMQSPDLVSQNFEKLAELFPNCVTESASGKAIDFDLLKQELNHAVVEGNKERYRLEWPGKREAIVTANLPTTKTLRPVREDSVDFDNTENIYIEGDNLEVLKLLQESYLGKIKMIYIDPPYNTGNDFVYKDNFAKASDEELFESGQKDELSQRLVANPETSGRYHSDWLSMMYTRLKLARNLLKDDGVIFVSIDDNEVINLRKVCDEIFGESNFVNQVVWLRNSSGKTVTKQLTVNIEYLLIYSKSESFKFNTIYKPLSDSTVKMYSKDDNDGRGKYRLYPMQKTASPGPETTYDYVDNNGKVWKCPEKGWRMIQAKMKALENDNRLCLDNTTISEKAYWDERESEGKFADTLWDDMPENSVGSKEVANLFEKGEIFSNPKPTEYLMRLLKMQTNGSQDIVLDFFSGSCSTAHAILKQNSIDGGKRKFIMVQLPEECDEWSVAFQAGYKTINAIGKERIRRAAKKIKKETSANIDYGFRVYRLDESNMQDVYYRPQDLDPAKLDMFADNVKPDRTEDDLLAQVMLDWGLPLSLKIEQANVAGKKVFKVAENSLFACFDKGIDEAFAKEIAKEKPLRIVFKDTGFKDDTAKTNVKQLLKQLSPETEMKVL